MQQKHLSRGLFMSIFVLLVFMITLVNTSCKTTQQAGSGAAAVPSKFTMQFRIDKQQLQKLYNEKWAQKIIFELQVMDMTNKKVKLLMYVAKNHHEYARYRDSISIAGDNGSFPDAYIAGNCELDLKSILYYKNGKPRDFTTLVLNPDVFDKGPYKDHFTLKAVAENALINKMEDIDTAIPCPPGHPFGDSDF